VHTLSASHHRPLHASRLHPSRRHHPLAQAPPRAAGRGFRRRPAAARGGRRMMLREAARRIAGCLAVAALALLASPAYAAEPIEIFDAHLHYNWEPKPYYQLDEVLALFRKHRVTG